MGNDNATPRIRLYANQEGQANIVTSLLDDISGEIRAMDTGDVNGDGIMDIVASDVMGRNLMLFLGQEGPVTSIERVSDDMPDRYTLEQNYPNPFNPVTTIAFSLEAPSIITLKIYDLQGRELIVLVSGDYPAGRYETSWDASGFASGVYVYRLQTGTIKETKMLTLVK